MWVPRLSAVENVRLVELELECRTNTRRVTITAPDSSFADCKQLLYKQVTGSAHPFQQH